MSKILLIGANPPPLMRESKVEAANYRTWQFLEPLVKDGHQICLCAGGPGEYLENPQIPEIWQSQFTYVPVRFLHDNWQKKLQSAHDSFNPDCVVAVNYSHSLYATKLRTTKPVWMDIYGDMITIMQASAFRANSDRGLGTTIRFMREILQTGDAFSGCGFPQKHALVGELAMIGRLNNRTFGYEFAHVVYPGAPDSNKRPNETIIKSVLYDLGISDEHFILLWCGGYNTWTDVHTLFAALDWSMSHNPAIRYLSVGDSTYGGPNNVYEQFKAKIADSEFRDRYHLIGWQPWSKIGQYYDASDAGLNIDALHYETIYGTRTRLLEMMAAGLPIITSLGSELSYLLKTEKTGLTFEVGDWQELGGHILKLSRDTECRIALGRQALSYASNDMSFYNTTASLRAWVKDPQLAPDRESGSLRLRLKQAEFKLRTFLRYTLWKFAGLEKV